MKDISLGVIDDHTLFRQGMIGLLNEQPKVKVVLEAGNGLELLNRLSEAKKCLPDVLLLDIEMPEMNGIEATRLITAKYPQIKIIALTMHDNDQMIFHLIDNGASGFLPKNTDIEVVVDAIFSVYEKGYYLTERVSTIMAKSAMRKNYNSLPGVMLTDREKEVLRLICSEYTVKEIASLLSLSHRTVETHKLRILGKTGAKSTVGMVLYAMNNNLLNARI